MKNDFEHYIRAELTKEDTITEAQISFVDQVRQAYSEAVKRNIKANSIVINKNLIETKPFIMKYGFGYNEFPPMICGLEVKYTAEELPDDYAFSIVEAVCTERQALVERMELNLKERIMEWVEKHKFPEAEGISNGYAVYVDDLLNFLGLEVDDGENYRFDGKGFIK